MVRNLGEVQVPWRFLYGSEGILMQGTGILPDGTPIHVNSYEGVWQSTNGYTDYYAGTATFWYGWGGPGYELTSYIHGAVGPSFRGGIFYVPDFATMINYPGGGYISGVDRGEAIKDYEMDLFVGVGYRAIINAGNGFGLTNPIDHGVPVYQVICQKPGAI